MKIKDGMTEFMRDEVSRAYDIEDMREILLKHKDAYIDWKRFINEILALYAYNVSKLAADCGFSRNTVKKWRDSGDMPRSRKEFIKLGFGVGMNLREINDLLQRYGRYPGLYAKSIEDAIYIYALTHGKTFAEAEALSKNLPEYLWQPDKGGESAGQNGKSADYGESAGQSGKSADYGESADYCKVDSAGCGYEKNTAILQDRIMELDRDEDLLAFIRENRLDFNGVYEKLVRFLDSYLNVKTMNYTGAKESLSLNSLLSGKLNDPQAVGIFNDMLSALRTRRAIPNRLRLVALGIHLEMTVEEIDEMLGLANMERLCPKDKIECAVIFAVDSLLLNDHDDLVGSLLERLETMPGTKERCLWIIDKYRRIDEAEEGEYSKSDVAAYLAEVLRSLDIEEARELLELLG